ncbi:hypothetical protein NJ76_22695 [Rhodococcus sp. IITR03]|nr:hypothetical protein NJ76_22695 [Rhodococcus sp. IITR03]
MHGLRTLLLCLEEPGSGLGAQSGGIGGQTADLEEAQSDSISGGYSLDPSDLAQLLGESIDGGARQAGAHGQVVEGERAAVVECIDHHRRASEHRAVPAPAAWSGLDLEVFGGVLQDGHGHS